VKEKTLALREGSATGLPMLSTSKAAPNPYEAPARQGVKEIHREAGSR